MTRHATSTIHDVSSLKNRDAEKLGGSEARKYNMPSVLDAALGVQRHDVDSSPKFAIISRVSSMPTILWCNEKPYE